MTHQTGSRTDQQLGSRHSWCSVYTADGRCCGHLVSRGRDGFEAFNLDDKSIGIFSRQREAAEALRAVRR
jgi:hypothetical protein